MQRILKFLLLATAVTPLIYTPSLIFPFVTGKAFFFRALVELGLILFIVELIRGADLKNRMLALIKQPLFIFVLLFFVSAAISTFLADNVYRAFWGEAERMEGLFGWLHYLAFFVMAAVVFQKREWFLYIKTTLVAGTIIVFYSFLQFFGWDRFPFAFSVNPRPDAFLGNSSYLGTHFLFLLPLAILIFINSEKRSFWRYFSLLAAILFFVELFLSSTRGALVGLLAGLVFIGAYYWRVVLTKKYLLLAVILIFLSMAGFWATRSSSVWQKIPGLNRVARVSWKHPTVQTRLISISTAGLALKEKPILGWGLENVEIAYNKYYNPDYLLYEASWFDRAHNKILDVAVMQGLLGLALYLTIFGWVFFYLIKNGDKKLSAILSFLFVAYFVQNLFVFDQVNSYLMFFVSLGLVFILVIERNNQFQNSSFVSSFWFQVLMTLMILPIAYSIFAYNYLPYRQARTFNVTRHQGSTEILYEKLDNFLEPYTFVQSTIRGELVDLLVRADAFSKEELNLLTNKALAAMEDYVGREPYSPRSFIRLAEMYNNKGRVDASYFTKAEVAMKKALELSPRRQELYFTYAYSLVLAGKKEQALATARQGIELSPNSGRAHYIFGAILYLANQGHSIEGEASINKAFELGRLYFNEPDYQNMITILSSNIIYHVRQRNKEAVIKNADRMKDISEDLVKEMDIIIELTKKERWGELDIALKIKY